LQENQNTNEQLQSKKVIALEAQQPSEPSAPAINQTIKETLAATQPETINNKQETAEMEVQKHPHHVMHKKQWNEYLLEFFMLFLAVFLGFVAENIRERLMEQHREKEYLVSLLEDLKEDAANFKVQIAENKIGTAQMDSLTTMLINPALAQTSGDDLYYFGRLSPRLGNFAENVRTYQQLTNSGNFRLIDDRKVSDTIMSYYMKLPHLHQLEGIFETEFVDYKKIASQVFEPAVFMKQANESGDVIRSTDNPALQTYDPKTLKQLALYVVYMNGSRRGILAYEQSLLQSVNELISFLEKTYSLSN